MNIRKLFTKFLSKENETEISKEDIQALAEMIKGEQSKLNVWDKMFGILCFNIWHNSSQDFQRSHDIQDIEIPFLCAIGVFQNLNNMEFFISINNLFVKNIIAQNLITFTFLFQFNPFFPNPSMQICALKVRDDDIGLSSPFQKVCWINDQVYLHLPFQRSVPSIDATNLSHPKRLAPQRPTVSFFL